MGDGTLARMVWSRRAATFALCGRAQGAHGRAAVGHGRDQCLKRGDKELVAELRQGLVFGWSPIVRGSSAVWPGFFNRALKIKECMAEVPKGPGCPM